MSAVPGSLSIDTAPHPRLRVYSSGNLGEVAPERLSVMAWSLVGDPMERGSRALVERLSPRATWHTGSNYAFVAYFSCRPYHNLSGYWRLASEIPGLDPEEVGRSYFEDAAVPDDERPRRAPARLNLARAGRVVASLGPRVVELEGLVAALEARAARALSGGRAVALGAAAHEGARVLDRAWEAHVATTASLVPLRALQRAAGRRLVRSWDDVEPWVNRPDDLVWESLHDARSAGAPPGAFLDAPFYEVAAGHEPWSGLQPPDATRAGAPPAAARDADVDVASAAWSMLPRARGAVLKSIASLVSSGMAHREETKSLVMRCLHVFRALLPELAAANGVPDDAWPLLTLPELLDAPAGGRLQGLLAERRDACAAALATPMPDRLDLAERPAPRPRRAEPARRGRGLSPGWVSGVVVTAPVPEERTGERRILVCDAIDADLQPVMRLVDGIVTAKGSMLSHAAILAREYGIPAVAGHPATKELKPGQWVTIDGTSGELHVAE